MSNKRVLFRKRREYKAGDERFDIRITVTQEDTERLADKHVELHVTKVIPKWFGLFNFYEPVEYKSETCSTARLSGVVSRMGAEGMRLAKEETH